MTPRDRRPWFDPGAALEHAGGLEDTPQGRQKYLEYLKRLAEDEPTRKAQQFEEMSRGWIIGSRDFAKDLIEERTAMAGQGRRISREHREASEAIWQDAMRQLLAQLGRSEAELGTSGKSADWKIAVAAVLKERTTATNRWLGKTLHLNGLYEVSRKMAAWIRDPEPSSIKRLNTTTNHKA